METVKLNNGIEMPVLGLGTFLLTDPDTCERSISEAIRIGYRLIDTAQGYGNEEYIGRAVAGSDVAREELFITTKVWFKNYEHTRASVEESMRKLQTDYLDLVLLHWPFGNTYAAWRELEKLYAAGRIRAIGVSNYTSDRLIDLMPARQRQVFNMSRREHKSYREIAEELNLSQKTVEAHMHEALRFLRDNLALLLWLALFNDGPVC